MRGYSRVSEYLSREVLHSREAVLAENVSRDRYLRNRESLSATWASPASSVPPSASATVSWAWIHLYCIDPHKRGWMARTWSSPSLSPSEAGQRHPSDAATGIAGGRDPARCAIELRDRERADRRDSFGHEGDRDADRSCWPTRMPRC